MSRTEPYIDLENKEMVCPWCGKREFFMWPKSYAEIDESIKSLKDFKAIHEDCQKINNREAIEEEG